MTNIWADSFKDLRDPFFQIQDPYTLTEEKKEKEEKNDEDDAGEDQEHKYKKRGKKSKDYDGDGEVEDEAHEYAGVKDKAIKKAMKEDRDLHSNKDKNKKIDTNKSVNNKIKINPTVREEFESWVNELLEEGYDLSEYTWDELEEIYEANSTAMPPRGDAETKTDITAKRRTAQMQIRKELADVQLAKAKSQSAQTNESVISYLSNRYNLFED